eukprot:TCONS_00057053-protein
MMEIEGTNKKPSEMDEKHLVRRKAEFMSLCLRLKFSVGKIHLNFNPLSSLLGALVLWLVIGWAIADWKTSLDHFNIARRWITDKCTWFYISSQLIWVIVIFYVYFKYGKLKLGLSTDKPEYGNFDYFAMIFTTGICNGLFYDGANAPIVGYRNTTDNLLIYRGKSNHITQAQNSLNVVLLHWGFHGFSVYILPCLLLSVLCYRKGLPLTMRSSLYPVFGKKIFGRLGDIVDSVSLICIGFGVSTSFILGAIMLVVGLQSIVPELENNRTTRFIALWAVTGLSMISALSGIKIGIRRMSQLCFLTGALFTITIALSDNIFYLLNLAVQSIGHYTQFFVGTSTFTGAFLQQGNYPGKTDVEINWMHENTVFYWGWWLGWAPLVAIFATRISKGRTIKNVVEFGFLIPILCNFIWFVVIGGVAIDMQNQAIDANLQCGMTTAERQNLGIPTWVQRLGCVDENRRFFLVLEKYEDIKIILQIIALLITLLYFITSFDSAALVMGSISSNGEEKPPLIQRIFWCITLAAVTSVLLIYEERVGRAEITGFTILAGLPFAILLCLSAVALWRLLKLEPNWSYDKLNHWAMIYGNINSIQRLKNVSIATIAPWYFLGNIANNERRMKSRAKRVFKYVKYAIPFYLCIILLFLRLRFLYINNLGWAFFIGFVTMTSQLRTKLRHRDGIQGNVIEDIVICVIYPLTVIQIHEQAKRSEERISNPYVAQNRTTSTRQHNGDVINHNHNYVINQTNDVYVMDEVFG